MGSPFWVEFRFGPVRTVRQVCMEAAPRCYLDTNDLLSVARTVQFDGCMFSIPQIHIDDRRPRFVLYGTKHNIMHFMMFMYIMYIMHIMHIMQDAP